MSRTKDSAILLVLLFSMNLGRSIAAQEPHFWYDRTGENWVHGGLYSIHSDHFTVKQQDGTFVKLSLEGRSDADQSMLVAHGLLLSACNTLHDTVFPGGTKKFHDIYRVIRAADGDPWMAYRLIQGDPQKPVVNPDDIYKSIAAGLSRWRWVLHNGMEYEIDYVQLSDTVPGVVSITVKDHAGQRVKLDPRDFPEIDILPREWRAATYRFHSRYGYPANSNQLSFYRGPTKLKASVLAHLTYTKIGVVNDEAVWTLQPIQNAYREIAKAKDYTQQAEQQIVRYHIQRHEIVGENYLEQRNYAAAVHEFQAAINLGGSTTQNELRLGYAQAHTELASEGINKIEGLARTEPRNSLVRLTALELLARHQSLIAKSEKDSLEALAIHESACQKALDVFSTKHDYLESKDIEKVSWSISSFLVQQRKKFHGTLSSDPRENSLYNEILHKRNLDILPRAVATIHEGIQKYSMNEFDGAKELSETARKLSLDNQQIQLASLRLGACSLVRKASSITELSDADQYYSLALNEYAKKHDELSKNPEKHPSLKNSQHYVSIANKLQEKKAIKFYEDFSEQGNSLMPGNQNPSLKDSLIPLVCLFAVNDFQKRYDVEIATVKSYMSVGKNAEELITIHHDQLLGFQNELQVICNLDRDKVTKLPIKAAEYIKYIEGASFKTVDWPKKLSQVFLDKGNCEIELSNKARKPESYVEALFWATKAGVSLGESKALERKSQRL